MYRSLSCLRQCHHRLMSTTSRPFPVLQDTLDLSSPECVKAKVNSLLWLVNTNQCFWLVQEISEQADTELRRLRTVCLAGGGPKVSILASDWLTQHNTCLWLVTRVLRDMWSWIRRCWWETESRTYSTLTRSSGSWDWLQVSDSDWLTQTMLDSDWSTLQVWVLTTEMFPQEELLLELVRSMVWTQWSLLMMGQSRVEHSTLSQVNTASWLVVTFLKMTIPSSDWLTHNYTYVWLF